VHPAQDCNPRGLRVYASVWIDMLGIVLRIVPRLKYCATPRNLDVILFRVTVISSLSHNSQVIMPCLLRQWTKVPSHQMCVNVWSVGNQYVIFYLLAGNVSPLNRGTSIPLLSDYQIIRHQF
jgi:hypothetical protein